MRVTPNAPHSRLTPGALTQATLFRPALFLAARTRAALTRLAVSRPTLSRTALFGAAVSRTALSRTALSRAAVSRAAVFRAARTRAAWPALCVAVLAIAGCSQSLMPSGAPLVPQAPTATPGVSWAHLPPHTVTAARGLRSRAELDVVSGATTVTVGAASLGRALLTASTPADSGVAPDLVVGSAVQVFLDGTGLPGPAALRITLNSAVQWQLVFSGGASQTAVDMSAGRIVSADFTAGSSLINLRLPEPSGTASVVLAGGASQLNLTIPAGVPARLRLDGGASAVTLGGRSYTGIAGGTVLTEPGWASAARRYDIDAPAGISTIFVTSP